MRIQRFTATNFKSLVDFQLDLAKFSCLIGLNGAGKSTVLQFIDFLAQQVRGDIAGWLDERGWEPVEVLSRLTKSKTLTFAVTVLDEKDRAVVWSGTFDPEVLQCTAESVKANDAELEVAAGNYSVKDRRKPSKRALISGKIPFTYQGSILSQLRRDVLPKSLLQLKEFLLKTESLDMLTPERLRQRTRSSGGSLGHGGRNLSAFVYELGFPGRKGLAKKLKQAYERIDHVYAKSIRSGWKQLKVSELFGSKKLWTEARHVNDGMLRMIAILAELTSTHDLVLFDEIENGINPELVEFVTDTLVKARQQVLVTTHSPMILNYLDDETARNGVIYLYKSSKGYTKSIPFFSIPSLAEKLTVMGPGEAFVDTNLTALADEIAETTGEVA
jgi:ABC-type branched-subunit amino acid transport system ATPase component